MGRGGELAVQAVMGGGGSISEGNQISLDKGESSDRVGMRNRNDDVEEIGEKSQI